MKSGATRRILSGVVATALVATLSVPAMAANTIKEQVNQGQEQEQTTTQGSMDNFKSSSTYTGFQDVATSDWYYTAVKTCYELDLMKGNSATTFNPKGNVTVAQVITMAARVHKIYFEGTGDFESVSSKWYQAYVDYALAQGIIKSGDFSDYDKTATRAEMAYVFANALPSTEYNSINTISELPDVGSSTKYSTQIFSLYNAGIVAGSDKYGTFNPNSNISRAEAAAIINRVAVKSERKTLALEKQDVSGAITIYEGQSRSNRPAKVGDIVIKSDGTKVILAIGPNGVLGEGQGVAPDLNLKDPNGSWVVRDQESNGYGGWGQSSVGINYINDYYYVNPLTGEGHWGAEWQVIQDKTYPDYDGKVGEISSDKNYIWNETGIPCWMLIACNTYLVQSDTPATAQGTVQTITEGQISERRPAKEGDIFIKADGTQITLKNDVNGVLGGGQGVAPDIGMCAGGENVKNGVIWHYMVDEVLTDSLGNKIQNDTYYVNKSTGEGYWGKTWMALSEIVSRPTEKGSYDGQVSTDSYKLYRWSEAGGFWTYNK